MAHSSVSETGPLLQTSSLFFTMLLPELRFMIYEHVFGPKHLHMFIHDKKLAGLRCLEPTSTDTSDHEKCIGLPLETNFTMEQEQLDLFRDRQPLSERSPVGALLTACRLIYSEAVDVLYRTSTIHFSNIVSICVFPRTVIPHHLDNVRHVRLSLFLEWRRDGLVTKSHNAFGGVWPGWDGGIGHGDTPWECVWAVVASMRSLHTLVVTIHILGFRARRDELSRQGTQLDDFETPLFEPLKQISPCNYFLLRVSWPSSGQQFDEYPFRLERFVEPDRMQSRRV
ncbi:hypothetical protein PFICI_10956 [Pestalotiopsis fici W106-1]|uniref:DUF7730 domain-containing protein n=1 Tax=Pestalotiopsis fici (strain W106-1 / CGMCC3.15140) TaxID=1229662 RepID=W3WVA8_PESFW|nr:uncharacterized protein PFICI_10956 [Pestalotiopsis fici W106-1]ETS77082.1 hypothetical protein PFICI_10956 [Pestalotiopsis fici W106-1]